MTTATIPKSTTPTTFRSISSLCHPCITTTHLSYSFLSLKLPPPPCAVRCGTVLLAYRYINIPFRKFKYSYMLHVSYSTVKKAPIFAKSSVQSYWWWVNEQPENRGPSWPTTGRPSTHPSQKSETAHCRTVFAVRGMLTPRSSWCLAQSIAIERSLFTGWFIGTWHTLPNPHIWRLFLEYHSWKKYVTIWLFYIAMENGPFIDGLPIIHSDFPWLC